MFFFEFIWSNLHFFLLFFQSPCAYHCLWKQRGVSFSSAARKRGLYIKIRWAFKNSFFNYFALDCQGAFIFVANLQLGESSDSTKESSEYLQRLTDPGVILQRAIRHVASGKPSASVSPPRVCSHLRWQKNSAKLSLVLNLFCFSGSCQVILWFCSSSTWLVGLLSSHPGEKDEGRASWLKNQDANCSFCPYKILM